MNLSLISQILPAYQELWFMMQATLTPVSTNFSSTLTKCTRFQASVDV